MRTSFSDKRKILREYHAARDLVTRVVVLGLEKAGRLKYQVHHNHDPREAAFFTAVETFQRLHRENYRSLGFKANTEGSIQSIFFLKGEKGVLDEFHAWLRRDKHRSQKLGKSLEAWDAQYQEISSLYGKLIGNYRKQIRREESRTAKRALVAADRSNMQLQNLYP